jgi:hypothetical protein
MSNDLPGPRCGQYVDGGFSSFPCWIEAGHDGPCVAVEVPVSGIRRDLWLKQQSQQPEVPQAPQIAPSGPVAGVPVPPRALDPRLLADPAERQEKMLAALATKDVGSLPDWVRQGIISSSSQVSLATLYQLAREQFAQGATVLTITPEFLDRLIIPVARDFFDLFLIQNKER